MIPSKEAPTHSHPRCEDRFSRLES